MTTEPVVSALTTPVDAATLAIAGLLLAHVPPVAAAVSVTDEATHTAPAPLMVAEAAEPPPTVTVAVVVAVPQALVTEYVIVAVPALLPLTTPVVDTEAMEAELVDQLPPATVLVSVVVAPVQIAVVPEIDPADGAEFTVMVAVVEEVPQELVTV
jgi:hypothetical protein